MAKTHSWFRFTNRCGDSRAGFFFILIGFLTYGVNHSIQEKHVHGVDISLKNPEDGYFLKFRQHGPQTQQEALIITESTGELPIVQAQLGPFFSVKPIPRHLLDTSIYNGSNILDRFTLDNQDISVHLVSQKVTPESPKLQILIHAGVSTRETLANTKLNKQGQISGFHLQNWCGQLFVQHFDQEVSGACILSDKYNGCVAGVGIPEEWWASNETVVHLYYQVTPVTNNLECVSTSSSIIEDKSLLNVSIDEKRYLTTMPLLLDEEEYKDLKDKHVVISVPSGTYRPGAHFYVPIKLEANSDLQVFAMRARARNGLRILGATEISDSPWQIHVEISDRQKSATVTASLRESAPFVKRVWPQEVFHWMLQVDEHLSGFEVGRIIWSIEYEVDGKAQEHYFNPDPRFVSKINIQPLEEKKLIPVLKVTEIMNVAALTGRIQTYPLQIFVVNDEGNIHDVTWLTSCHSSNDNVLKVSKNCSFIYVDGKEKLGSRNVTVIAKSRQLVAFTHVTVWMPEERLNVQLSDNKLSQIKKWKTPKDGSTLRRKKREKNNHHHANAVDDPHRSMCRLRYQQTTVDVYASFCILENGKLQYYTGKKTYVRVTDLVKDRLRMSDPRIASLNGNLIVGQAPGLTEIQVLSPTGRVMAAKEIRVGHDKVSIQRLVVNVVSGINLEVREAALNDPTTILALLHVDNRLKAKFQEAILDIALEFTDKTTVALKDISPADYKLEVISLNRQVIKVPRPFGLPYQPAIIATGTGDGPLLNVSLRLVHRCSRKNMHPLVSELTQVHVLFTKKQTHLDNLQSDGHYDNKVSGRWNKPAPKSSEFVATIDVNAQNSNKIYLDKVKGISKVMKDEHPQQVVPVVGYVDEETVAPRAGPKSEPQLQQVVKTSRLSVLEIIMYVLLAVFCMAIIVFTVNCVVFTVRYRRKQMPKDTRSGTEPVSSARDWVWVGQATLERNAINTRCAQTLMPEEDFNGNQMRARLYSGTGSTGSSASASAASAASGGAANSGSGGSNGGGAGGSNRNSTVSTYMGSECSIRITANPLPPEVATASGNCSTDNAWGPPEWDYEALGYTYDEFKDYLGNLKESTA